MDDSTMHLSKRRMTPLSEMASRASLTNALAFRFSVSLREPLSASLTDASGLQRNAVP